MLLRLKVAISAAFSTCHAIRYIIEHIYSYIALPSQLHEDNYLHF